MILCVAVLSYKLYQVSKIRQSCTATKGAHPSDPSTDKSVVQGLSSRDVQVVKSVVIVCFIFIISQFIPCVGSSITRLIDPEIAEVKSLGHNILFIIN
ncbi:hypothetical protein ElyMa_004395500 [Elysia marginata]|uniref:Uncharacterized protein n=1 Tax=Elysia marginata TaxID=1093978 RepID=A0AAV4H9N3_9GAST|nr:hypothetical protein ElyMa_004395500 [Elysia marginata]